MGARNLHGLAALCLAANGFKAESFTDERLRDGRISSITSEGEGGRFVVRVFSGLSDFYAEGTSRVSEDDARAQALQVFHGFEQECAAKRPGDFVVLEGACF